MDELGRVALRAAVMYLYLLVLVRIAGKRTVGNFTAFDLLASLMIGDVVQAILEPSGQLSVRRIAAARPAEKRDVMPAEGGI